MGKKDRKNMYEAEMKKYEEEQRQLNKFPDTITCICGLKDEECCCKDTMKLVEKAVNYLAENPEWGEECMVEVDALLKHDNGDLTIAMHHVAWINRFGWDKYIKEMESRQS